MARGGRARRTLISVALLAVIGAAAFAVVLFSVADLYTNRTVAPSDLKKCSWWATTSSGWSSTLRPDCAVIGQRVWDLAAAGQAKTPASRYQGWAPAATTCAASSTIVERYEASLGLPHEQTTLRASSGRDCGPESWGADCPTRASIARGAPRGR